MALKFRKLLSKPVSSLSHHIEGPPTPFGETPEFPAEWGPNPHLAPVHARAVLTCGTGAGLSAAPSSLPRQSDLM